MDEPRAGDLVFVGRAASVQFDGDAAILLRVIRVYNWMTYEGWRWLEGYEIGPDGLARDRRSIFVRIAGLQPASLRRRVGGRGPASRADPPGV